jgi:uncharacterized protein YuzE
MRMTYDESADAAYIYLMDEVAPGAVVKTSVCSTHLKGAAVNLDFDRNGKLLGIELLGARLLLSAEAIARLSSQ